MKKSNHLLPTTHYLLAGLLLFIILSGAGCIEFKKGTAEGTGGVWKTVDRGGKWLQQKAWLTSEGVKSIGGQNVRNFTVDPQDHLAIYAGTEEGGLFYTYDAGASWFQTKQFSTGRVRDVAVDPKDKCTIYVATEQRIWKSTDCSRSFQSSYYETRANVVIMQFEMDWFSPEILYAGTSSGDIIKSMNSGVNWTPVARFKDLVRKIYIDPFDSRTIYVGLREQGLRKTTDGGANWEDLKEGLKDLDRGKEITDIVSDTVTRNLIIMVTNYGILRSADGGTTWQALELLTPAKSVIIRSIAVNPKNGNEIYYGTDATFYKTANNGADWNTEKLPTKRSPTAMMVDPESGDTIYMGMTLFKE